MTRPWTRGESQKTRPHALPAPGAPASGPRSPRAAWAFMAAVIGSFALGCAGRGESPGADGAPDPETRALRWIAERQLPDGSFPTEDYLPREIGTALVTGLLASATKDKLNLDPVLARSVRYFSSLQSTDGAFRYSQCPDVAMNTSLTLLALFACRDRDTDTYRNDGGYVEVFDPRLLHRFFLSTAKGLATWDDFLERRELALLSPDANQPEPEDLFRSARRALKAKDAAAAMEIRSLVLRGQVADGSWEEDGPSDGRKMVGLAYRIRTLELLHPLLSDTLVRR